MLHTWHSHVEGVLCLQHQLPTCKLFCTFTPQLRCQLPDITRCGLCLSLGRQQLNSQLGQSQCEYELQNAFCPLQGLNQDLLNGRHPKEICNYACDG